MVKRANIRVLVLIFGFIMLVPCLESPAQDYPSDGRAARYYLGTEDELLIPINIWGYVRRPGQYMVPNNTDLISLISFAGGPSEGAKIKGVKIVRSNSRIGNRVWNVNVQKFLDSADGRYIPVLKPGDTVVVKGSAFSKIRNFFSFMASFAIFAQMIYWVVYTQRLLQD